MEERVDYSVRLPHGGRNGVLVEHETGRLWWETVRTRRGARRAYGKMLDGLLLEPARSAAKPGDVVTVCLLQRRRIVELAASSQIPAMYHLRHFVEEGGLISYGADYVEAFQQAARLVDKILNGAKPADLPVEDPTTFEPVINLKTAKALGLTIPPSLLLRADQVIE